MKSYEPLQRDRTRNLVAENDSGTGKAVVQALAAPHRDRFHITAAADEIPVMADHKLIVVALMQLVDNAIKYSVPESPIDIWFGVTEAEASVTVRDHGW